MLIPKYIHSKEIHNTQAAEEIVPYLLEYIKPQSVIDVGCGLGTWLEVFKRNGVNEILGIEGEHVNKELLKIGQDELKIVDLELPFKIDKKFDLTLSLEVAEHLSHPSADTFIHSLIQLSDYIIFSAAIPDQGGQNHINEQWIEYWQQLFDKYGFILSDCIRPRFWNNENVEWWYRQNMFFCYKSGSKNPFNVENRPLNLIHPKLFILKVTENKLLYKNIDLIHSENEFLKNQLAVTVSKNDLFEEKNKVLLEKLNSVEKTLKETHNSISWKVGHSLVKILVIVVSYFDKIISIFKISRKDFTNNKKFNNE